MSASMRSFDNFPNVRLLPKAVICFGVSNQIGYKCGPKFDNIDTIDMIFAQSKYQENEILSLGQSSGRVRRKRL